MKHYLFSYAHCMFLTSQSFPVLSTHCQHIKNANVTTKPLDHVRLHTGLVAKMGTKYLLISARQVCLRPGHKLDQHQESFETELHDLVSCQYRRKDIRVAS